MFELVIILSIGALFLLGKLLLRNRRHARLLQEMANQKGWAFETDLGRALPEIIAKETIMGFGDPENENRFNIYRKITGVHRNRNFLLISRKIRRRRSGKGYDHDDSTFLLTRLAGSHIYPIMAIRPASKILDAWGAADNALAKANGVEPPTNYSLSPEFNQKHVAYGFDGVEKFMTLEKQNALLANPDIFHREDELWYQRFYVLPGLSEEFAWIKLSSVDPHTIMNRLDALMDWAMIAERATEEVTSESSHEQARGEE